MGAQHYKDTISFHLSAQTNGVLFTDPLRSMDSRIKRLCGALTRHKIKDSYLQGFTCSSDPQVWQVIVFLSTEASKSEQHYFQYEPSRRSRGTQLGLGHTSGYRSGFSFHTPAVWLWSQVNPWTPQGSPTGPLRRMRAPSPGGSLPSSLLSLRPTR